MQQRTSSRGWLALSMFTLVLSTVVALAPRATPAHAAFSLPSGFTIDTVVSGLAAITAIDWADDGRMFIAEKSGKVRVFENGALLPTPFIDISAQVNSNWDRGMLGMVLHPDFPTQPYVYLLFVYDPPELPGTGNAYNAPDGQGARVARLLRVTADPNNTSVALPNSAVVLLGKNSTYANIGNPNSNTGAASCEQNGAPVQDCIPADSPSHSIDAVLFGADGSLFVGTGDGAHWSLVNGRADARSLRAQNLDALSGKIFRINPITGEGYADNSFFDGDPNSNRSKVYSYGLRNPFRFTIDPATGEPFIGDVGASSYEEVNTGRGANFGWPCYEGPGKLASYQNDPPCTALYAATGASAAITPLHSYNHSGGGAISGVGFYTGTSYPAEYQGVLFMADYNNDWIKYLKFDANGKATRYDFGTSVTNRPAGTIGGPAQLITGPDTNLYFIGFNPTGNTNVSSMSKVFRIRYTAGGNTPPIARAGATPTNGSTPLTVTFSSAGSTDPDAQALIYSWAFGDGGTSTDAHPMYTYTTPGDYAAVLTVTDAAGATHTDSVAIQVGNNAPVASITAPTAGQRYRVGQVISFRGAGTDMEDGALAGQQLQWNVLLNHNQHVHPDFLRVSGTNGSFIAPDHGDNTAITICLTATDSRGASDTTCRTMQPETTTYTFRTEPPGFDLIYSTEGLVRTAPFSTTTIVNSEQLIIAPLVQQHRSFNSWSDGGAAAHSILASTEPQTYTATYINSPPVAMAAALPGDGPAPLTVTYSSTLSFDPEGDQLSYGWEFSDGATAETQDVTRSYTRPGAYQATLTVTDELGLARSDTITINVQNNPPLPTIAAPSSGTYGVGTEIDMSGSATDIEDGNLTGGDLVWQIIRHADGATELLKTFTGTSGAFVVPESASATALARDQWIEIRLTALDRNGSSASASTTLLPLFATLTIDTVPSGLSVRHNGAEKRTPLVFTALTGSKHTIEPVSYSPWRFDRWSDQGQPRHTVVLPASGATLTAHYHASIWLPSIKR